MTESMCFTCRHFRQAAQLDFMVSGYCGWTPTEPLPPWLANYVDSQDRFYGPKRDVGRPPYAVGKCAAHVLAHDAVIRKRRSDVWYE
jgi:hypothetical protein